MKVDGPITVLSRPFEQNRGDEPLPADVAAIPRVAYLRAKAYMQNWRDREEILAKATTEELAHAFSGQHEQQTYERMSALREKYCE